MAGEGEGPAIGIDLGTTYSCVAVWQNDRVEIIANDQGNRTMPSYVAFTDKESLVGDAAKNQGAKNPANSVFGNLTFFFFFFSFSFLFLICKTRVKKKKEKIKTRIYCQWRQCNHLLVKGWCPFIYARVQASWKKGTYCSSYEGLGF
jgi:hypothetical protein